MNTENQTRLAAHAFIVGEPVLARIVVGTRESMSADPKRQLAWQLSVMKRAAEDGAPWLLTHVRDLVDPEDR